MNLKEMKVKTFSLIEEYYPTIDGMAEDEDVLNKINGIVNQIQLDLMKYRKINASIEITIEENDKKILNLKDYISDCFQIKTIVFDKTVDYSMPNDETIILSNDYAGTFNIYYYKYPRPVKVLFEGATEEEIQEAKDIEDDSYQFELDDVLLEIMPYGIAADLLKMDMISGYGRYFYDRYLELKNGIDPRRTSGHIKIEGGVNV